MSFEQKDNSGALFHNKQKKSEKGPDYSGECVIDGVKMEIAGWKNTSSKGTPYLSLKFQPAGQKPQRQKQQDPDADIPF